MQRVLPTIAILAVVLTTSASATHAGPCNTNGQQMAKLAPLGK